MAGYFITFEGGEGAGKSTQIRLLTEFLQNAGKDVIVTREPGGSPGAEKIRDMLLSGKAKDLGPRGEAMLFATARADHVDATIKPALDSGSWVLCDRFADSTRVYQGQAGVDSSYLSLLETAAIAGCYPDLTILIDIPAEIGLERVQKRSLTDESGGLDRFEEETLQVHQERRERFLDLAKQEDYRFVVIDGTQSVDQVAKKIQSIVGEYFADHLFQKNTETEN